MQKRPVCPLPPRDRNGRRIRVGDRVRIVGVPDLRGLAESERPNTAAVFEHICGTYKRVSGFDTFGHIEIFFTIRRGRQRGMHSVVIEPYLLLLGSSSTRTISSRRRKSNARKALK